MEEVQLPQPRQLAVQVALPRLRQVAVEVGLRQEVQRHQVVAVVVRRHRVVERLQEVEVEAAVVHNDPQHLASGNYHVFINSAQTHSVNRNLNCV